MKVKIRQSIAGTVPGDDDAFSYAPGEVREVDAKWGKALCESGVAEPVAEKKASRAEKRPSAKPKESR